MQIAVVRFPGSNCDMDVVHVLRDVLDTVVELVWHNDLRAGDYDAVILPGGFSYGDYLRSGVIAAFSPAMKEIKEIASRGAPVLGICNGFQILVEAGMLPGALLPNSSFTFVCKWVTLKCETNHTPFTQNLTTDRTLSMPVAHQEGRFVASRNLLSKLTNDGRVVFRYVNDKSKTTADANPNGSMDNIAGICNSQGNVLGLMPHPERASERIISRGGITDGLQLFESMVEFLRSSTE